jgi:hypothetical protein
MSANPDHRTKVYSTVMRFTEREKRGPTVAEVADLTGLGALHVCAAVGDLTWLFLHGSGTDPENCTVEVEGE